MLLLILAILALLLLAGFGFTLHVLWWVAIALLVVLVVVGLTRIL